MSNPQAADSAVGLSLRRAREAAGLSLGDVATRSRIPVHVLQALEAGDWTRLGAPVFVRGHVRQVARVLGIPVPEGVLPSPLTTAQIPSLVSHSHVPRYRYVAEQLMRRAVYIVLTAALVVPAWLATREGLRSAPPAVSTLEPLPAQASAPQAPPPMVASIASLPPVATATRLELTFEGDSWLEVRSAGGAMIERGLVRAGQRRALQADEGLRVTIGNAGAVRASRAGAAVGLDAYAQANVARFTLSSDGSLAPIAKP